MNTKFIEAREYVARAREALRRGDKATARILGKRAAAYAPGREDAWLVLAASDPNPQDALAYARKALEINPRSPRARRGVEWASGQLKQAPAGNVRIATKGSSLNVAITSLPKRVYREAISHPQLKINGQNWLYPAFLIGAVCIAVGFAAFFALIAKHPTFAYIVGNISPPVLTRENLWAPVYIAKPAITPIDVSVFAPQVADVPGSAPSNDTASIPTDIPTLAAAEGTAVTPQATETPGTMAMEIVDNNPMSQSVSSAEAQVQYPANGARWIDVNLSEQRVYAYEGDMVVNSFIVSTGTWQTPTVTGKYKIYIKVRSQAMSGPGYYLPNVPYVMFFYKGYGFHGTYWHNNFGIPMSRGCVNLTIPDSEWLYSWGSVGTVVNVHY